MTPSKKLKPQLIEFDNLLENYFERCTLNKSSPKQHVYHDWNGVVHKNNKGVKSDLIFIYKLIRNKQGKSNFSFSFDYIDKPESEYTITVGFKPVHHDYKDTNDQHQKFNKMKLNENIISSKAFTVSEFRELIKEFNVKLSNVDNVDQDVIFNNIFELFFEDKINFNKIIEQSTTNYNRAVQGGIRKVK